MVRSVFVTVIGDSFAGSIGFASKGHWFDLFMSARDCVEAFASTGDCLELLASTGKLLALKRDCAELFASADDFVWAIEISSALHLADKSIRDNVCVSGIF